MTRLIDADALKEIMYNEAARNAKVDEVFSPYQVEFEYFDIEEYIDNAPTIEPTELKQNFELAEPSGDLISRKTLIGAIEKCGEEKIYSQALIETIKTLPSADRPKGEWLWRHGGECSECGFRNNNFDFNYCPNCGADMRKDGDR